MENKKIDLFVSKAFAASERDAWKQLGWLYVWSILLIALTVASGLAR